MHCLTGGNRKPSPTLVVSLFSLSSSVFITALVEAVGVVGDAIGDVIGDAIGEDAIEADHAAVEAQLGAGAGGGGGAGAGAGAGAGQEAEPQQRYIDTLAEYDILIVDEAHGLCHPNSRRSRAFRFFSTLFEKRFAVTGTPIRNRIDDIASICMSMNCPREPVDFTRADTWTYNNDSKTLNENTNIKFSKYVSRVGEGDIDLPPMSKMVVNFNAGFDHETSIVYNDAVSRARNLRVEIERSVNPIFAKVALAQLISLLQKLSFLLTCPLLAEHGAAEVKSNADLIEVAAKNPSNAMVQLVNELRALQTKGHFRIVVAGLHVSLLRVLSSYIAKEAPDLGVHFAFDGSLSNKQKDQVTNAFLTCRVGILFLSIGAGGQGLHLVPGCQAMVLFGAAPWSAAECDQLFKRIHRLGQTKPVEIIYMVAYGSVDASIYSIHGCKKRLEKLTVNTWESATSIRSNRIDKRGRKHIGRGGRGRGGRANASSSNNANASSSSSNNANNVDDEDEDEDEDEDSETGQGKRWKKAARIVDALLKVCEDTGDFPDIPSRVFDKGSGEDVGAFTLVPGVMTRGLSDDVPDDAVPLEVEEEGDEPEAGEAVEAVGEAGEAVVGEAVGEVEEVMEA